MKNIRKSKEWYYALKVSPKLDETVNTALQSKRRFYSFHMYKPVLTLVCSFCIIFVVLLNINPVFANATFKIPIIGNIAKVFTIREYQSNTDTELIHVTMPALENTGNTKLEKRINEQIQQKVDALITEAQNIAREYKQMVEEAKDPEIIFYPMELSINYEVKCSNENIISFVLSKWESFYSFHEDRYFYNINLTDGSNITLQSLLGDNYKEIANKQIEEQIANRVQTDPDAIFFNQMDNVFLEHGAGFDGISDNPDFYINENGNPVIVFPKYSIAPGYMGILEFEIQNK